METERLFDRARVILAASMIVLGVFAVGREIDKPDPDGCDAKLTSPASWGDCLVIDTERKINETIFGGVSSELENVPVKPPAE